MPSFGLALVSALLLGSACSSDEPRGKRLPAPQGTFQAQGSGVRVAEGPACDELRQAESSARARLGCSPLVGACPAHIRPAGAACGAEYDRGSLDGCIGWFNAAQACDQLDQRRCVVTAYLDGSTGCGTAGAAGAAGSSGAAGEAGVGGSAGAGASGAAGAAGAAGQSSAGAAGESGAGQAGTAGSSQGKGGGKG